MTWFDARHEIEEVIDAHLAQAATLLIVQLGEDVEEVEHRARAGRCTSDARAVAFQIWEHGERLRLHSANAPDVPARRPRARASAIARSTASDWRVFSAWDRSREYLVHVRRAQRAAVRRSSCDIVAGVVAPLLVALPLLALLLWFAVRRGLRPLERACRRGRPARSRHPRAARAARAARSGPADRSAQPPLRAASPVARTASAASPPTRRTSCARRSRRSRRRRR